MIKASFVIESRQLTLAQISDVMACQPDAGRDRGSFSPIRQGSHPGARIEQTRSTGLGLRRIDVLTADGVGIESKVGRTSLTATTRGQIAKDQWLVANDPDVTRVEWVFSRSAVTGRIGPSRPLANELNKAGIPWSLAP